MPYFSPLTIQNDLLKSIRQILSCSCFFSPRLHWGEIFMVRWLSGMKAILFYGIALIIPSLCSTGFWPAFQNKTSNVLKPVPTDVHRLVSPVRYTPLSMGCKRALPSSGILCRHSSGQCCLFFSVFVWCWSWVWDRATTEFPFHLESSRVYATSLGQKCKWKSDAQLRWSVCVIAPLPSWVPVKDCRRVKPTIHTKNCHLLLEVTIVSDKQHVYCKVSESDCYYHRIN